MNNRKGQVICCSAPSGAGKSSLIQSILTNFENIELSISATTRSPREGEVEGKHYFFVTENEFNSLKKTMLLLNVQLYTTINTVLYINILMKG